MNKLIPFILGGLVLVVAAVLAIRQSGLVNKTILPETNPQMALVKNNGVLRVGVDATFYPMEYIDKNGKVSGFGADLASEIAHEFAVPLELINISWDDIFDHLNQGKIDLIISSVTITAQRSREMAFSKPYFNSGQVVMVTQGNYNIKDLTSLMGKNIGVQLNTTSQTEAERLTEKDLVQTYPDYDQVIDALLAGVVDAVIMDYPPAVTRVKDNPGLKLVGGPFTQEFYGVVAARGREDLLLPVNRVIERLIKTEDIKSIEKRWLK